MSHPKDDLYDIDLSCAAWRKSSYSNGPRDCLEITDLSGGVAVRDSKRPQGPNLRYAGEDWNAFCKGVAKGTL